MKNIYILSLLILLCTSCEKESIFTGQLPDPKLVLHSFIEPDSVIRVQVTRTRGIGQSDDAYIARNVKGEIYINGIEAGVLQLVKDNEYTTGAKAREGDHIRMVVRAEGVKEASAEVCIPSTHPTITVDTSITIDRYSEQQLNLKIHIREQDHAYRHYRLMVQKQSETVTTNLDLNRTLPSVIVNSYEFNKDNEPLLVDKVQDLPWSDEEEKNYYNIFTNAVFRGKSYTLNVSTHLDFSTWFKIYYVDMYREEKGQQQNIVRYLVKVLQLDEPSYLYLRSEQEASQALGLLNDPIKIYSNVKNGLGVVGTYVTYTTVINTPTKELYYQVLYENPFYKD